MIAFPLEHIEDSHRVGGKARQLARATRAGLPVPPGWALGANLVRALCKGEEEALALAIGAMHALQLDQGLALRSSAIDEDGVDASFAGQYLSVLGVRSAAAFEEALLQVALSAHSDAVSAYRRRLGLVESAEMGIVVQQLIDAEIAGVLFTKNPVTGADERVIEATWGLGEALVAGLVTPDSFRMRRGGSMLDACPGEKDLAIRPNPNGGQREVSVAPADVHRLCLDESMLRELDELAARCESHSGMAVDIEFAFSRGKLYLLQQRPITRAGTAGPS